MMEWLAQHVLEKYNFWIAMTIILIGLYAAMAKGNLLKKLIGLSIFQTAMFLWFISLGDVGRDVMVTWGLKGGTPPIIWEKAVEEGYTYVNPLPNVLMLTGIVVSAATTAVALAIVIRIYQKYGTIEEDEILERELQEEVRYASG